MDDQNTTPDTIPEGGEGTVEAKPVEEVKALTLEEINKATGREYKSVDAFLKSYNETRSYVGTQKEQKEAEARKKLLDEGFVTRDQYETDMFFSQNTAYARDRKVIEALSKSEGVSVRDVVNLDVYKDIASKITGFEKSQETENVLKTNPRITEPKNDMDKARAALKDGDHKTAQKSAIEAVLKSIA